MQEPKRLNLFQIVKKTLEIANRKNFIHRMIYVFPTENESPDFWLNTFQTLMKNLNESNFESPLVGFGIFYPGYVINTLEGTEDLIQKHFYQLLFKSVSESKRLKILLFLPHINKRYFAIWRGVVLIPPTGSQPPPSTADPHDHGSLVKNCAMQLCKLFQLLNEQSEPDSKIYNQYLPEPLFLDFLLSSPLLLSEQDIIEHYFKLAPDCSDYHQRVWPHPPDYVPHNILPDNSGSKL